MKRLFPIALCLCICTACASHPRKQKKEKEPEPAKKEASHRLVGTIVAVNETGRFVLIDAGSYEPAASGSALKSFSGGKETGVLAVSTERKPPFVIADIVGGSPQKGDEVRE